MRMNRILRSTLTAVKVTATNVLDFNYVNRITVLDNRPQEATFPLRSSIQYASGLYVNKQYPRLRPAAPYLLLCGDIGTPLDTSYRHYLSMVSEQYSKVFIIAGVTEYSQSGIHKYGIREVDSKIKKIATGFNNVFYLNNKIHELDETTVLIGSTLWGYVSRESQSKFDKGVYRNIYKNNKEPVTRSDINVSYQYNSRWLREAIQSYAHKNVIVATYSSPCKFIDNQNRTLVLNKPVIVWISGEKESVPFRNINGVICVSNVGGICNFSTFNDRATVYF